MEQRPSFFGAMSQWANQSLFLKLAVIGFVVLILMIPQNMILDLVYQRENLQESATYDVAQKWGFSQEIAGPILQIPVLFEKVIYNKETKQSEVQTIEELAYFLPERLDNTVKVEDHSRFRGIFEVQLFKATNTFQGHFAKPAIEKLPRKPAKVFWEQARLIVGVSNQNGIENEPIVDWNGAKKRMEPGTYTNLVEKGMSIPVSVNPNQDKYTFNFQVDTRGSGSISLLPLAKTSVFTMQSDWPHPSFGGQFVPNNHDITAEGFTATWQIHDLNRSFPQQWLNEAYSLNAFLAEVGFIQPINDYSKVMRAAKYAFLVIFLTFLLYFFFEKVQAFKIHPIQYLLVGSGIVVFYLLLLSFSEHVGFNYAYFIATFAIISLLTVYTKWILKANNTVVWMLMLLLVIYGFIFVVLQLEDHALLAGSIGVFLALSAVMYASRKIKWHGESGSSRPKGYDIVE